MKNTKRIMSLVAIVLLVMGFGPELSAVLVLAGNIVGVTKEELCILLGCATMFALIAVNMVEARIIYRKKMKAAEANISDFERKMFGKVITFEDLRNAKRPAPKAETSEQDPYAGLSEKERKFRMAQDRMEAARKLAPPVKAKKQKYHKTKEEKPSLKERAGGIRRAS